MSRYQMLCVIAAADPLRRKRPATCSPAQHCERWHSSAFSVHTFWNRNFAVKHSLRNSTIHFLSCKTSLNISYQLRNLIFCKFSSVPVSWQWAVFRHVSCHSEAMKNGIFSNYFQILRSLMSNDGLYRQKFEIQQQCWVCSASSVIGWEYWGRPKKMLS